MSLSEGEISAKIDALANPYHVHTGYRWSYPYLEIKLITTPDQKIDLLVDAVKKTLLFLYDFNE